MSDCNLPPNVFVKCMGPEMGEHVKKEKSLLCVQMSQHSRFRIGCCSVTHLLHAQELHDHPFVWCQAVWLWG